eukprot:CAMPEP_0172737778 /NCGR_PEP_ID=MMETSP1074-20121228/118579_1 /TAXON_ID=2916 /ORGANISM="Ceratium fusus, Strain PA161109" /LENGTH=67 /DNA_ID=CAMNT_0013567257 /DNA_START=103 /DNA_END=303 /DNA_ORIENTATION=-
MSVPKHRHPASAAAVGFQGNMSPLMPVWNNFRHLCPLPALVRNVAEPLGNLIASLTTDTWEGPTHWR